MQNYKFVAKLDLKNAYYYVRLVKEIRKSLAFIYKGKTYIWARLIQGISDGPTVFQRFLAKILEKLSPNVLNYLDDIAIGANSIQELKDIYKKVLINLKKGIVEKSVKNQLEEMLSAMGERYRSKHFTWICYS